MLAQIRLEQMVSIEPQQFFGGGFFKMGQPPIVIFLEHFRKLLLAHGQLQFAGRDGFGRTQLQG